MGVLRDNPELALFLCLSAGYRRSASEVDVRQPPV